MILVVYMGVFSKKLNDQISWIGQIIKFELVLV